MKKSIAPEYVTICSVRVSIGTSRPSNKPPTLTPSFLLLHLVDGSDKELTKIPRNFNVCNVDHAFRMR